MKSRCRWLPREIRCALLLNHIGDKGLQIFNTFEFAKKEDAKKYTTVIAKFEEYFKPTKNVTYERHIFLTRDMKDKETIDEYVTTLRGLSATCEFGNLTDSLIKDKLVQGVRDKAVKDRLLRTKDLDLRKAIDICKAAETTKTQLEEICAGTSRINVDEEIHRTTEKRRERKFEKTLIQEATSQPRTQHQQQQLRQPPQWWRGSNQRYHLSKFKDGRICQEKPTERRKRIKLFQVWTESPSKPMQCIR